MITGCCASCGFEFNLEFGLSCPRCRGASLRWARKPQTEPFYRPERYRRHQDVDVPHILNDLGTTCRWDCVRCSMDKDKKAIDELNRIYSLEDTR
jgi:hypothetical protein